VLVETCCLYVQNLPTIVTLLPRAGLALAFLFSFFSPENILGGLSLSDVDQSIAHRDGTFFDKNTGALSNAKGVLIANAAWAAWRTLVLLLTWCVALSLFLLINYILNSIKLRLCLWIFSAARSSSMRRSPMTAPKAPMAGRDCHREQSLWNGEADDTTDKIG
jgi:hypothetical protein